MLLSSTLQQIIAAPKPKKKVDARRKLGVTVRKARERKLPSIKVSGVTHKRSSDAMDFWRGIFEIKDAYGLVIGYRTMNVTQMADASKRKLTGAYSAINRLKQDDWLRVAYEEQSTIGGRPILYWTWNPTPDPNKVNKAK